MKINEIEVGYFLSFAGESVRVKRIDRTKRYVYTDKRIAPYSNTALKPFLVWGNMKHILLFGNRNGSYSTSLLDFLSKLLQDDTPIALHLIQEKFNAEGQTFKVNKNVLI